MSVLVEKPDLSLKIAGHYNHVKELLFNGSPDVLNGARKKAFQDFILQGIPTYKNENYKYTNLQPSFLPDYKFYHQPVQSEIDLHELFKCDIPQLDTHLVLLQNGWYYQGNKQIGNLPEGVIIGSLVEVAKTHPDLVKKYYSKFGNTADDPLVALNTAFAKDGFFVYVPKNVKVDKPIQIINLLESDSDTFVTQRNMVIAEMGSEVKLIICDHTLNANKYLSNSVTEISVGENSNVDYYMVQNQHNNSTIINSLFANQETNSNLRTFAGTLHGGMVRNNLKVVLNGENAEANVFGMAFTDRKQHVDNFTQIIHAKPNCLSNQVYKNVLDGKSTCAFSGRINVVRDAQKTNAFQRNNNLLLTDEAKVQTKPQLIIDADDVKCSHGATVGQIDEEALFYLRARGIGEKDARLMMMNAFAHEVVQEIKVKPLQERIDELVDKRLKGEISRCHDCEYKCDC